MDPDLLGKIMLDGRQLGACYFPALPAPGQLLRAGDDHYRITAVSWVVPSLVAGRGIAEIEIDVAPGGE
jgi:hypothetical protein